jgi:hypothetical protein
LFPVVILSLLRAPVLKQGFAGNEGKSTFRLP